MNKKICVYAIAKNESKFIERWYNSVKEADYVCVLDTGSTDDSVEKFKKLNIICSQKLYKNFRFDTARNDSLNLIPKDAEICVCVDLDEEFKPGWSKILKENWKENTTQARYRYTWNFNADGSEGVVFMADKIHKNGAFKWLNPVHEILKYIDIKQQNIINLPTIQLNHKADTTKSRKSYLPLLELSIKENPEDDRNTHYLGREYMFYGEYDKAIKTLKKHLTLKNSTWPAERCASLRYIANCYKYKNNTKKQEEFLLLACLESPNSREPYYELGIMYYNKKNYLNSIFYFEQMLKIKTRELNYISLPQCWDYSVYDYLSFCYYKIGNIKKAIYNIEIALKLHSDKRLENNLLYFQSLLK